MFNTEILNEFFIWEENNLTELKNNCLNNTESVHCDTTTKIKSDSIKKDWRDITDPKLRRKMRQKQYRETHREYFRKHSRKSYYLHHNKILTKKAKYRSKNREKCLVSTNRWKRKNKNNIKYTLPKSLRGRLSRSIKGNYKSGSAVSDLGCTITELKLYLESKFQPGMNWDTWGLYGWHIDHIKPLASFDLTDRKQLLEACHYTNLQPLWAKDNLSKGRN